MTLICRKHANRPDNDCDDCQDEQRLKDFEEAIGLLEAWQTWFGEVKTIKYRRGYQGSGPQSMSTETVIKPTRAFLERVGQTVEIEVVE